MKHQANQPICHNHDQQLLDAELANILSTIRWCYQTEQWTLLIEFLVSSYLFLRRCGYWDEEEMLSRYAVEACHKTDNRSALGMCLRGLAAPFYSRREYDKAEELCLQAKQVYEETGNMLGVATTLEDLGQIACKRGDLWAAWKFHIAQLSLSENLGAMMH